MAKKAKQVSINPQSQTVTSEQFLNGLGNVIQQAPQAYSVLIAALNQMAADTNKVVLDYLAAAAGLEKVGENLWRPKVAPKPEVVAETANSKVEEGV